MIPRLLLALGLAWLLAACSGQATPTSNPNATPAPTPRPLIQLPFGNSGTATPSPEATETRRPSPTPGPVFTEYKVTYGDTLGGISAQFNMSIEELMEVNGLTDPHSLQIGQVLKIPTFIEREGPAREILPDSEVVYGPAYKDFDVAKFLEKYPNSYLANYSVYVERRDMTGPEIVQLVAERFSVGPRALLALIELQGGWVTSSSLTGAQIAYPVGAHVNAREDLYRELFWAANQINAGYYGKITGRFGILEFTDRERARVAWDLNPGSAGIQYVLAKTATWEDWQPLVSERGYRATYEKLFGDPAQYAVDQRLPKDLKQPTLRLPLEDGKQWFFTGGPHAGWVDGSPWAAVDFAPADQAGSCWQSTYWAVAAAPGVVTSSENGRVVLDLDGDGFQGTGWALLYMHMGDEGRVEVGTRVKTNDPIGNPSCQGGDSQTSHVHFARLYNGQWIAASDPAIPLVLSGWVLSGDSQEYNGAMTRGSDKRSAENQRLEGVNDVIGDGGK
ncbi:MAG: LysM peptidoglycan-binding domain-containing protein [Anaerolineae bacterium]|nr:LysM peptidoglycan-binding domain-containing protein [Anaerolineae bacterium]